MKPRKTTYMAKKGDVTPKWLLVDATDQVLGRLAVKIARVLQGKHRPTWTPHVDTGDYVVITNAAKLKLTGNKASAKVYTSFSGHAGGLKTITAGERLATRSDEMFQDAVRRMLPKSRLGRQMLTKLKVFAGDLPAHGFAAQSLEATEL